MYIWTHKPVVNVGLGDLAPPENLSLTYPCLITRFFFVAACEE